MPCTGKTHLATGIAIRACQAGHRVQFATASQWVDRLAAAHAAGKLQAELARVARRRPLSAKRQRFVELRERGWSVNAAAREVGVSRSCGANWSRGYKTYRRGQLTGFVAPLERLAVREISGRSCPRTSGSRSPNCAGRA